MISATDDEQPEPEQRESSRDPLSEASTMMDGTAIACDDPLQNTLDDGSLKDADSPDDDAIDAARDAEEAEIVTLVVLDSKVEDGAGYDDENPNDVPAHQPEAEEMGENDVPIDDSNENVNDPEVSGSDGCAQADETEPSSPPVGASNSSSIVCPDEELMVNSAKEVSDPDENTALISESESPSDECNRKKCCNKEVDEHNNGDNTHEADENTDEARIAEIEDDDEVVDGDFVAIELVSPKHTANIEQVAHSTMDHPSQPTTESIPIDSDDAGFVVTSTADDSSQTVPPTTNSTNPLPPRRKILRHPILTPLTKLPWDKFISAAGACDLLFNCKYTMRQVEDEVREERKKSGDLYLENGGCGGEADTGRGVEVQDRVGREDGYVNLSLGHECGDFHYGEEDGCDADEFAELGLHCCSMLDNEVDKEVEVVAHGHLLQQQQQQNMSNVEEEDRWEQVNKEQAGEENEEQGQTSSLPPNSNLLSDKQKAEVSW
eukprot:CAMPEP_0172313614 /NCGR_PEP_ID=MMETSP1058-20130122/20593_1 /TAXON_ID=83371 /ORGANISM="Detonula confervacea, Strain CCMP 353" /LENGTH=490 /DNA_ID=CAMNT_0013027297 /DNA_START=79 /DNA_END=1548 /DNA_ORIENTATION=-